MNKQTPLEVADSATGFDEMSITQHFGKPLAELQLSDSSMWGRALVFILKRREGLTDDDARNAVLNMPIRDVFDSFKSDDDETDDEADGESGKDEPDSSSQPES